jgi:group I intron endonuclease
MSNNRYKIVTPGIYCIINKINGMIYVGSAINIQKRKFEHFLALKKNVHANRYLQFAWNKYGAEVFSFVLMEKVNNVNDLLKIEQNWLDWLKCLVPNGYNLAPKTNSQLGFKHSKESISLISWRKKGTKISNETKAKMSAVRKGRKQSIEWVEKRMRLTFLVLTSPPIIIKLEE